MRHILCLDIETVAIDDADLALEPFIETLQGKMKRSTGSAIHRALNQDDKFALAVKKAALSPLSGKIACISVFSSAGDFLSTQPVEYFFSGEEKDIITDFYNLLDNPEWRNDFEYVTWNGRGFDFPFLTFRASKYNMHLNLPTGSPYNGRDNHFDVMLHLGELAMLDNLDSSLKYPPSLKKWQQYFGMKVKPSIKDGEINIKKLVDTKKWDQLCEYCRYDVECTWELFKKFHKAFVPRFPYGSSNGYY